MASKEVTGSKKVVPREKVPAEQLINSLRNKFPLTPDRCVTGPLFAMPQGRSTSASLDQGAVKYTYFTAPWSRLFLYSHGLHSSKSTSRDDQAPKVTDAVACSPVLPACCRKSHVNSRYVIVLLVLAK